MAAPDQKGPCESAHCGIVLVPSTGFDTDHTPVGCAAAYFPEANVLVALDSTADGSNTPASKSIATS